MENLEIIINGSKYNLVKELPPNENGVGITYFSNDKTQPKNLEQLRSCFTRGLGEWNLRILENRTKSEENSAIAIYTPEERIVAYKGDVVVKEGGAANLKEFLDKYEAGKIIMAVYTT